jgi:hypothetical protein
MIMKTIVCKNWDEVTKLTPTENVKVVVKDKGKLEGMFAWVQMWNPIARQHQLVRGYAWTWDSNRRAEGGIVLL